MNKLWICICFCIGTYVVEAHPYGDDDMYAEDVDVNEGEDLSIPCNTTESPEVEIYWTKNTTGSHFRQDGLRLNFTSINRTEHGDYICNALYNTSETVIVVEMLRLNVLYKAEVGSIIVKPSQLQENGTYTVTCDVAGNPPPFYYIKNNYTKVTLGSGHGEGVHVTGTLEANCGDTGPIICVANNSLNIDPSSMTQNVTVFCSPRPRNGSNTYQVYGTIGMTNFLIMNLNANPFPNYTWARDDGQPIRNAIQIDYPRFAVLNISVKEISEFTNYSLTMENEYGSYVAEYQLNPLGNPEMPDHLHYSDVTDSSVRMYWTSGYDMGKQQHFIVMKRIGKNDYMAWSNNIYDNSTTHGVGQNWTYLVKGLESDSDITLTVISINDKGFRSRYVTPGVTFHTLPTKSSPTSSHTTGITVGVTLGSVVVVGIAAGILVAILRRRRRRKYADFK